MIVLLVAVAVAVVLGRSPTGEQAADPRRDASPASPVTTAPAQAELDVSNLPIPRATFCPRVDDSEVPRALAAPVDEASSYANGDTVEIAPGVRDVAHEYGCTFAGSGAEARAWVFAAPVPVAKARRIVADARAEDGCQVVRTGTTYGTPGLTRLCTGDGEVEATMRGLFDDTWLTCQLTDQENPDDVLSRAGRWCVHVATTLGARR